MKHLANGITIARILIALLLLFTEPLSVVFFVLYVVCGITDMVDGVVARKTHTESKTGALLDSISDVVFLLSAAIKLVPVIWHELPRFGLYGIILIAILRIVSYLIGAVKFRKFVSLHTILNKVTGAALFATPILVILLGVPTSCAILCGIAGISAVEELCIAIKSKEYHPDIKGFFENGESGRNRTR